MIFVMAGTERFPFDRLFRGVEEAILRGHVRGPAFAQVGHSNFRPAAFPWRAFLTFHDVVRHIQEARIVVCHAGAGSALLCRDLGQVPILMPRRADLGEHVNDHQVDFAREAERAGIACVARTESELAQALAHHAQRPRATVDSTFGTGKQALVEHLGRLYAAATPAEAMRFLVNVTLALISFTVALGMAEVGLRVVDYKPELSSAWILTSRTRVLDDDLLTIDAELLTDRFYEPFAVRGTARLVVTLGDSFTAGFPVPRRRSYPSVLEGLLTAGGAEVRVMNAGLGDTGPDQQFRLFTTRILPRVKPDVVVWQFCVNDSYDNVTKPLFSVARDMTLIPMRAEENWMYRRQRFFEAVPLPTAIKRKSFLVNLLLRRYERDLRAQAPGGGDPLAWGRLKIELAIAQMNALAKKRGFRVYYTIAVPQVCYRDDVQPGSSGDQRAEYERLRAILQRQPTFIDGDLRSRLPVENGGADLFMDETRDPAPLGSRHFSEAGYARFARVVAAHMVVQ